MKDNKNLDRVYDYILEFKNKNGFIPSVREIGKALSLSSTSTIAYYLNKLEKNGKIKRSGNKNRAIEILDKSQNREVENAKTQLTDENFVSIPLVGQIAAGQPILALENIEDYYKFPTNMFKGENLFMLRVRGESMINAGINDGDFAIFKKQNDAENGEIVAAMWNDEATVKRFYKLKDKIRLQPENDLMEPIIIKDVQIVGKLVGLIRKI